MSRNVLLLQGPVGPFFSRFAKDLTRRGYNVTKVNFNGGDRFFYRQTPSMDYLGTFEQWESWLERVMLSRQIGRIYLFGDCRSYHRIARKVAHRLNARVFVFEEGYIRPNFITLEEGGVNGNSSMMEAGFDIEAELDETDAPTGDLPQEKDQPSHAFIVVAIYSIIYYLASASQRDRFSGYQHHRPFSCISEGSRWIRSGLRKWKYVVAERHVLRNVVSEFGNNYFVCPLQVHCDMQVREHSKFNTIEHFIGDVLTSFAKHAESKKAIVFKHHPLDRGYTDYSAIIDQLIAELGLHGRVFYVHDICLPSLLKHAQGTVLINSTVGFSSLFHGTPVKIMGKAIYDIPGLTVQGPLSVFWRQENTVDIALFKKFRSFLIRRNQLNGNFYRRISDTEASGLLWSNELLANHSCNTEVKSIDLFKIKKRCNTDTAISGNDYNNSSGGAKAA